MDHFLRIIQLGISSTTLVVLITSSFKIGRWIQKKDSDIYNLTIEHKDIRNRLDVMDNKVDIINEELGDIRTNVAVINSKLSISSTQEKKS